MKAWPPHQMNAEAAAHHCGVPQATFLRWVDEGVMPKGRKIGKYRLWLRDDLEQAVERLHHSESANRTRKVHGYDPEKIRRAQESA